MFVDVVIRVGVLMVIVLCCFNILDCVFEKMLKLVMDVVDEFGYLLNFSVRVFVVGCINIIGVIILMMDNVIFVCGIQVFQEEFQQKGCMFLVVSFLYWQDFEEDQIRMFIVCGVDVLLLIGC